MTCTGNGTARQSTEQALPTGGGPPLHDVAILFGLATIAWFIWVGVVLLKSKATQAMADQPSGTITGQAWAPSNKRFQPTAEAVR